MSDNSELKRQAEAANAVTGDVSVDIAISSERGPNQSEIDAVTAFVGAATPTAVLALIAESESLRGSCKAMGADMGKLARERNSFRSQADKARAEVAGLRTGYEAYEQVNAGLKAECEALRKDADRFAYIERDAGSGMSKIYGDDWVSVIDAALAHGEQS